MMQACMEGKSEVVRGVLDHMKELPKDNDILRKLFEEKAEKGKNFLELVIEKGHE